MNNHRFEQDQTIEAQKPRYLSLEPRIPNCSLSIQSILQRYFNKNPQLLFNNDQKMFLQGKNFLFLYELLAFYVDQLYAFYHLKYSETERATFRDKVIEAKKIIRDPDIPEDFVPFLSNLTQSKEERLELAKKVLEKHKLILDIDLFAKVYRDYLKQFEIIYELRLMTVEEIIETIEDEMIEFCFERWRESEEYQERKVTVRKGRA